MKKILPFIIIVLLLSGCASVSNEPLYSVKVEYGAGADSSGMVEFASGEIAAAVVADNGVVVDSDALYRIEFIGIDEEIAEQGYRIASSDGVIEIEGGDSHGLMYGGLEVAEQIRLYGIAGVKSTEDSPYILNRGVKMNIPLDMRTPSYTSASDVAQMNIESSWDMEFWKSYIDFLARNRYNTISLWSLNPFPSMVKVEGYEDIALDDVWKTTLDYDNSYNGTCTNLVQDKHWENYEVVKKITIDEKIEFWKEVMAYGKSRGIDFYIFLWNVYTYGEQGKYGITSELDNPVTKDYFRKSVTAMVETYPDLAGIGITGGENMGWSNASDDVDANEKWMHDVYALGINDALASDPDRDFTLIHRMHMTDLSVCSSIYSDFAGTLDFTDKYSNVHMYSTSTPDFIAQTMEEKSDDTLIWLEVRNEDCFDLRWGNPDYVRTYVKGMPGQEDCRGFLMGSDGYYQGYDYSSTDPDFQGQLFGEKHWYNFLLFGRMAFDPDMTDERVLGIFTEHFRDLNVGSDAMETLFHALAEGSNVLPMVSEIYYQEGADSAWFVSGCWSHPSALGFLDVRRWMQSTNTLACGNCMSIQEYCLAAVEGSVETDKKIPLEVAANLETLGNNVLSATKEIRSSVKASRKPGLLEKEFWLFVSDAEAFANLGLYYSQKILGAVELRFYNETQDTSHQEASVAYLNKGLEYWKAYAATVSANYVPQMLARVGYFDVNEITKSVEKDVETASKWKPRVLGGGYNAPSARDYYSK